MYVINIDKDTSRVLSASYTQFMPQNENSIIIAELPIKQNIIDFVWDGTQLIYSPMDRIKEIPKDNSINELWAEIANAIRGGVNAT